MDSHFKAKIRNRTKTSSLFQASEHFSVLESKGSKSHSNIYRLRVAYLDSKSGIHSRTPCNIKY